jgi:putative redox protein
MERVLVRQNSQFEIGFWASDSEHPESDELQPVVHIHELSPYGMLLASLGACTAIVLHSYAQHHEVDLREVELWLEYRRVFDEDCDNCELIERYEERIEEEIVLDGDLSPEDRTKLLRIAHQCPIYKMLGSGLEVHSQLADST